METSAHSMEEFDAKVARLEKQRDAVKAEAERAVEMLEKLEERRAALGLGPLSSEKGTVRELASLAEAMDEEAAVLSRKRTTAEDAARGLDQLVVRAKIQRREEEKRLARERYETLCEERYSVDGEAEEAMARLVEILDRMEGLHVEQINAAHDAENSSLADWDPSDTIENWLARRLQRWLPNGSFDRYDAPLPELDLLAHKPKTELSEG